MDRKTIALVFTSVLCAASCARANVSARAPGVGAPPVSVAGSDLRVLRGPLLTKLPPNQRFRFVSPDSLVAGLGADDVASVDEPRIAALRQAFTEVVGTGGWVESADSAEFDVTIFTTARMGMGRSGRPLLTENVQQCGGPTSTAIRWCPDEASAYTEQWGTAYRTYHIIRRRSDGAVQVRRRPVSVRGPARVVWSNPP